MKSIFLHKINKWQTITNACTILRSLWLYGDLFLKSEILISIFPLYFTHSFMFSMYRILSWGILIIWNSPASCSCWVAMPWFYITKSLITHKGLLAQSHKFIIYIKSCRQHQNRIIQAYICPFPKIKANNKK